MLTLLVRSGEEEKAAVRGEEVCRLCPEARLCLPVPVGGEGDLAARFAAALKTADGVGMTGEPLLILSPVLGPIDSERIHAVLAALAGHPDRLAVSARQLDGNLHPVMLRHLPADGCDAEGAVVPAGGAANLDWAGVVTPDARVFFPPPHLAGGSQFLPAMSVVDGAVAACTAGCIDAAAAADRRRWLAVCDENVLCRPIAGQV